jgi:hypothetical protein
MSLHFPNLVLRFLLEITSLIAVGMWGWRMTDDWYRYFLAIGLPLMLATIWGVFNVPGDPSRSGSAPVVVPGFVRLIIEAIFFGIGALSLLMMGHVLIGWSFIVLLLLHYVTSMGRITWLLKR